MTSSRKNKLRVNCYIISKIIANKFALSHSPKLYLTPLNIGCAHCKIIANKFALSHSPKSYLTPLNIACAHCKIIANKFALSHSLALYLPMYSGNRIQDFYIICSIASESPPRKMNELNTTNVESLRYKRRLSHSLLWLVVSPEAYDGGLRFLYDNGRRHTYN